MKKKCMYFVIAMGMVLAVGCGKKEQGEVSYATEKTVPVKKQEVQKQEPETESQTQTQEELPEVGEFFKVDVEVIDGSRRDDEGNVLANIYMQYPLVNGSSDAADVINSYYKDVREGYSPLNSGVLEYVEMDLEAGASLDNFPYEDRTDCVVSCNDGKHLCVISYDTWYAGGVANSSARGDVFSSITGKRLSLPEYYEGQTPEQVKAMVVEKCKEYFAQSPDEGWNLQVVEDYNVEEYNYYLLDGTVYVCFGPYEVSFGGWYRDIPIGTY